MIGKMQFDFIVNKENSTLTMKREFAAARQLVWDCYTKEELLERWFAPKPFTAKSKEMDFRAGGKWLYAMVEPGGNEHWGLTEFVEINPIDSYTSLDGFCDSEGVLNPALPRAKWNVSFKDLGEHTLVETVVQYNSLQDLETIIKMGMEEGMASTLERLDELLAQLAEESK